MKFFYLDGKELKVGDEVVLDGTHHARVKAIIAPGTPLADALGGKEVPVFFLEYEGGGLSEEDSTNCDLLFIRRARRKTSVNQSGTESQ